MELMIFALFNKKLSNHDHEPKPSPSPSHREGFFLLSTDTVIYISRLYTSYSIISQGFAVGYLREVHSG